MVGCTECLPHCRPHHKQQARGVQKARDRHKANPTRSQRTKQHRVRSLGVPTDLQHVHAPAQKSLKARQPESLKARQIDLQLNEGCHTLWGIVGCDSHTKSLQPEASPRTSSWGCELLHSSSSRHHHHHYHTATTCVCGISNTPTTLSVHTRVEWG